MNAPLVVCARVERRDIPGERPQYGLQSCHGVLRRQSDSLGTLANGTRTVVVAGADFKVGDEKAPLASSS